MPISHHVIGSMANHSNCLLEKPLSCLHIPLLTQHGVHQIPLVVDSSIQISPLPMNFQVGFIDIPGCSCLSMPFCSQLICEQRSKSCFPVANRLMRKRETTFEQHFCEIAQTQCVAQSPENHEQNTVCGEFERVKGGACSFVEKMFALSSDRTP